MFNGYRVSICDDENVLEIDSGDSYTRLPMQLMPLNCTCKNGLSGKFYVYFTKIKNIF